METIKLEIRKLEEARDLPTPQYMTKGAAGMDLYAALNETLMIKPGEIKVIPVGFKMALPVGYEAQIRPRSGLASRYGITIINTPGTVDSDYRGEVKVPLINLGENPFYLERGERIAQMVIHKCPPVEVIEIEELSETTRNEKGFGHTG